MHLSVKGKSIVLLVKFKMNLFKKSLSQSNFARKPRPKIQNQALTNLIVAMAAKPFQSHTFIPDLDERLSPYTQVSRYRVDIGQYLL